MNSPKLQVTIPFLPPLEDYGPLLEGIWDRNHLTNQGPLVRQLEQELGTMLDIEAPIHTVANGGLGIQIALKALGIRGKVVTTPFSYVATSSCPIWGGIEPVFADIERTSLGLDPAAVEASLSADVEAILATHVFGNACDIEALESIADRHGLALIFDAAHAFGCRYRDRSLIDYGDLSIVSTHATKVFQTVEGGFVTGRNRDALAKVEWMRRFGHDGEDKYHGVGINAKMSELHAAMGLAMMPHFEALQKSRSIICKHYDEGFADTSTLSPALSLRPGVEWNHAYYPVLFESEAHLCSSLASMNEAGIYPRRYFHPSLDRALSLPQASPCPVAHDIADRILCLPLHHQMTPTDADRVIDAATHPADS